MTQVNKQESKTSVRDPAARMKQLVEMSHDISIDRNIPVSKYFNSGRELIKSAAAFEGSGDIEKAFVLYLRYMTLFLEKLIHHPEYGKADRAEKTMVKNECNNVLELAENLKKRILNKYNEELEQSKLNPPGDLDRAIKKRSVEPDGHAPQPNCDIDEIDRKFNFSHQVESQRDTAFDPFNIEELKRSFETRND